MTGATDAVLDGGGAYVFAAGGGVWTEQAYVHPATITAGDGFGGALALDAAGATLGVGATGEGSTATGVDGDASNEDAVAAGAVYLFAASGGAWLEQSYVKASNAGAGDAFGYAVELDAGGDTLAVGALYEDSFGTGVGSAETDHLSIPGRCICIEWPGCHRIPRYSIYGGDSGLYEKTGQISNLSPFFRKARSGSLSRME